jgi:hypothetical protein
MEILCTSWNRFKNISNWVHEITITIKKWFQQKLHQWTSFNEMCECGHECEVFKTLHESYTSFALDDTKRRIYLSHNKMHLLTH